jgi:hypothetical protein
MKHALHCLPLAPSVGVRDQLDHLGGFKGRDPAVFGVITRQTVSARSIP